MQIETRRKWPRYRNVSFDFSSTAGNTHRVKSNDASIVGACFPSSANIRISDYTNGEFMIGDSEYSCQEIQEANTNGRKDMILLKYKSTRLQAEDSQLKLYKKPPLAQRILRFTQQVSKIHLYEAQERWSYLFGLLDYYYLIFKSSPDKFIILDQGDKTDFAARKEELNEIFESCRKKLKELRVLLTRNQQDLNFLWREITQVHVTMLREIFPYEVLPAHLDFCREEVRRLRLTEDSEIKGMMERLTETLDESGSNRPKIERLIRALVERFNAIRSGRIHEQLVTIRCYQKALLLLLPITILLLMLGPRIVGINQPQSPAAPVIPADSGSLATYSVLGLIKNTFLSIGDLLGTNPIAFVFFCGLLGGFFSLITRLRSTNIVPGEDAYFTWYVLTKPWIGAIGAIVVYLFLKSDVINIQIGQQLLNSIKSSVHYGPEVFTVAFLSGFTERLALPGLWESSSMSKKQKNRLQSTN